MTESDRRSSLFKEVNTRIRELNTRGEVPGAAGFVCECGRAGCTEILDVTVAEYDALRAMGDGYLVMRGHESDPVQPDAKAPRVPAANPSIATA